MGIPNMKLSKFYRQAVASLESEAREEVRASLEHGIYSDVALAVEAHVSASAERAAMVVETLHDAMESHSDAGELRDVVVESMDLRDGLETVNQHGGYNAESLYWANEACAATFERVGSLRPLRAPSQESGDQPEQFHLSLEDFDAVVSALDNARSDIAAKSLDGIARVFSALEDALPEIRDRMQALKNTLGSVEYDEEKQIRLDDYITKQLSVNGQVPSSLKDYLMGYGRFADALLGAYSENALEAASKASDVGDCLTQLGDDACPIEALNNVLKAIGDPRSAIAPDQLGFILPGSGPLFGVALNPDEETDLPEGPAGDLMVRMKRFCEDHAPLDPMAYDDRPEAAESSVGGEAPTIRVLSKDTICCGLETLIRLIDGVNIKTYAEARRDAWVKARSAYERYRQALQSVTPTQANNLRPLLATVGEYCDTLFTLSAWPALHFLANLVFTSNAFVLLAERSIAGRTEEVEVAQDGDVTEVDVTETGDGDAGADLATGDDAEGGDLTDTTSEPAATPDAHAEGDVGAQAIEPPAEPVGEPAVQPGEEPVAPEAPATGEEPPAEEAPAEAAPAEATPPAEEPASAENAEGGEGEEGVIPQAEEAEEPEAAEGGEVIPPAPEEAPAGTEGPAEVIPAAPEEEEGEEEEGDVIPNAEEEEEEEEEAK